MENHSEKSEQALRATLGSDTAPIVSSKNLQQADETSRNGYVVSALWSLLTSTLVDLCSVSSNTMTQSDGSQLP